jgi:outer membrane protein assembly factor BamB
VSRIRHGVPLIIAVGIALVLIVSGLGAPEASTAAGVGTWTQYGHDAQRTGKDPAEQTAFSSVVHEWDVSVTGNVYAQPLVYNGRVFVATEENWVYAFDATTGAPVWSHRVGLSVPASVVPNGCSNSNPNIGITSTPAIDTVRGLIYVVAQMSPPLRYDFFALDVNTGNPVGQPVTLDPWPGATQADKAVQDAYQVQRSALLLVNDSVYVAWGGRAECGGSPDDPNYQGWLVRVPLGTLSPITSFHVPQLSGNGGGIWSPPGPSADSGGNLYVPTGNSFPSAGTTANLGQSVVKLLRDLTMVDHWTVTNWLTLTQGDFDVGSHTPSHLGNGVIFQSGKDGRGFLLRNSFLGGGSDITKTGGELFTSSTRICAPGDQRSYGVATWISPMLFVPCVNGIKGVHVSTTAPYSFNKVWDGPPTNYPSSAMIAGGALWYIDQPATVVAGQSRATLAALNPSNGTYRVTPITLPENAAHFAAPASGNGRIYAPSVGHLSSYRMVPGTGPTPTPTSTPTRTPTPTPPPGSSTVTFTPVADTYTARSAPDSAAGGTSTFLRADIVRTDTAFLRFDLASLAGKTITAAALRVHTDSSLPWSGSNVTFNIHFVSSNDWKEAFMTYNNSVGPFAIAPTAMATLRGPLPNTWYQSTGLTLSIVQARAGALLSMAIDAPQGDVLIVDSRESGTTAPQLVVTFH